jgi:hypothetical protein
MVLDHRCHGPVADQGRAERAQSPAPAVAVFDQAKRRRRGEQR